MRFGIEQLKAGIPSADQANRESHTPEEVILSYHFFGKKERINDMMTELKKELIRQQLHILGEDPEEILSECDEIELIDDSLANVLQLLQQGNLDELSTIWCYTIQKLKVRNNTH